MVINSRIKSLVQLGQYTQALQLYSRTCPLTISNFTFPCLLKACASLSILKHGQTLHSTLISLGLQSDPFITSSLVAMYAKCGSFDSAVYVFDKTSETHTSGLDVTVWNSVIDVCFRFRHVTEGIARFRRMQLLGVTPDAYTLCVLLGACGDGVLGYRDAKQIHAFFIRKMLNGDPFLETALVDKFLKFGRLTHAWRVFLALEDKNNVVAWNVMISGFCENGLWEYSLVLYSLAKHENVKLVSGTFASALSASSQGETVCFGRQVHCDVVKMGVEHDSYVSTSLLTMYAKCEMVQEGEKVFGQIPDKGIELWNAMIAAYAGNSCVYEALEVYSLMRLSRVSPDSFTVSNVLSSCSKLGLHDYGMAVHADLLKRPIQSNISVLSALLTMHSKCGSQGDVCLVFNAMEQRDVVAWGSMISAFCQNKNFKVALKYFKDMEVENVKPDSGVMSSVINACTGLEILDFGTQIHGYVLKGGLELDVYVGTSLIDMYSKSGLLDAAANIFSRMPQKTLVAWNSMISCYCWNGVPEMSIRYFHGIVEHGLSPDMVSISSVLAAISSTAVVVKGKSVHGYTIRLESADIQVENALIDMYIKCGFLKYAEHIFQKMLNKDTISWNLMISGYGSHGDCLKALSMFDEMKSIGVTPDDVTFLSLISACNHSGFIEEGQNLFRTMREEYRIIPKMDHYVNIVDLLGRAGRLEDAYDFIRKMDTEADRSIWLCLLCACRAHRSVELGEVVAQKLLSMEPSRGGNYAPLINLYGESEQWSKAAEIRTSMKERGVKKIPGCSWIEVGNTVLTFVSGDPKAVQIYDILTTLKENMELKCLTNTLCTGGLTV